MQGAARLVHRAQVINGPDDVVTVGEAHAGAGGDGHNADGSIECAAIQHQLAAKVQRRPGRDRLECAVHQHRAGTRAGQYAADHYRRAVGQVEGGAARRFVCTARVGAAQAVTHVKGQCAGFRVERTADVVQVTADDGGASASPALKETVVHEAAADVVRDRRTRAAAVIGRDVVDAAHQVGEDGAAVGEMQGAVVLRNRARVGQGAVDGDRSAN